MNHSHKDKQDDRSSQIHISVICPMYNEEVAVTESIGRLKGLADRFGQNCEILIINDGSRDRTLERAREAIGSDHRFKLISHRANFGRGRALRTGFREALGEIIVTTEGDLSWGEDVVEGMVRTLEEKFEIDAVFASPHARGGGYENVPRHRIFLSRVGNRVLRLLYGRNVSMLTGMTRAYRREAIKGHLLSEDGKELHLEISQRLILLNYRIYNMPAILRWPEKSSADDRSQRNNWSKLFRIIRTHISFAIYQGVENLFVGAVAVVSALVLFFGSWAVINLLTYRPSIFLVQLTGVLSIIWLILVLGYFLLFHLFSLRRSLWRLEIALAQNESKNEIQSSYYIVEKM